MRPLHFLLLLHPIHNHYTKAEVRSALIQLRNPTNDIDDPPTTSAPSVAQILGQNNACQLLGQALGICNSLTTGFPTLQPSLQAQCLCYSSTVYAPGIFDGAVKFCADYASTAAPGAYGPLANLNNFCGNAGGPHTVAATATSSIGDSGSGSSSLLYYEPSIVFPTTLSLIASSTSRSGSESISASASTIGGGPSSLPASTDISDSTTTHTFGATITITPAVTTQTSAGHGRLELRRLTRGDVVVFSLAIATVLTFL